MSKTNNNVLTLAYMLGLGNDDEIAEFINHIYNPTNLAVIKQFDSIVLSYNASANIYEVVKALMDLELDSKVLYNPILGGKNIGRNRYDATKSLYYADTDYVLMMDFDDDFTGDWDQIIKLVRKTDLNIIDLNYMSKSSYQSSIIEEGDLDFTINKVDATSIDSYSKIDGYKPNERGLRTSSVTKFVKYSELPREYFKLTEKYEDSFIFAKMMSDSPDKVGIIPGVSIIYNRERSGVLVDHADPELFVVLNILDDLITKYHCTPYIMAYDQLSKWIYK